MKPKQSHIIRLLTVGFTPATTALTVMIATPALAQVDATWNGTVGDNIYGNSENWSPATAPTVNGDTATWDGSQEGPLSILWNAAIGGFGGIGVGVFLTGDQTDPVTLNNTTNGLNFGLTGVTIDSGAGAFTFGGPGNPLPVVTFRTNGTTVLFNDSTTNTATIKSNVIFNSGGGGARVVAFDGDGNWLVENPLVTPNGGALTVVKDGGGTTTITNANVGQNNGYTINDGTLMVGGAGRLGGPSGVFGGTLNVNSGTLSYQSTASQTISSAISGFGDLTQGAGTLTLTGNSFFSGTTTVTGGTMVLGGAGQMEFSELTINGASAKFVQTSSIASFMPITLTQGTLDGTGSVGAVTVGNGTGGIITHGNGGTGALTIDNLTFDGAASLNFFEDGVAGTAGVIVTGELVTTPANGLVTVNASQTSWANETTFDLLTFGSFAGTVGDFTKGTISGLSIRQSADLVLGADKLSLQIAGDNPVWTGLDSGNWVLGGTGASGNWKLIGAGTKTDYIAGDNVLFDDSAAGTTAVNISGANVSPSLVAFNNSTKDFTVSGGFGIAAGSVIKTGTGKATFSTANTYAGGTTVSAGTLALSGTGTLGAATGALTVNVSGIVDLGTTSQTLGTVSLSGDGAITNGTISPETLTSTSASAAEISAIIAGSGSVVQSGSGSLTLSGANTHTGGTTATSGTLILSGAGTLGDTTGALNLNNANLDLGNTSQTVGTVTKSGTGTISNGTLAFSVFNDTHTVGTGTISAKLTGTGELNLHGAGGITVLTGDNDYTGPTFLNFGTILRLGDGGTTGSLSPLSDITVENGARFSTNRSDTITQGVDFGLLTGGVQGGVILIGTGTTVLNLANTFTAGGAISAGTVVARSNGALGSGINGPFNITGGSLHLQNDISMGFASAFTTHGVAEASDTVGSIMSTGNNTLSNIISFNNAGTGNISNIVSLSGTLTLNGAMDANASGRTFNFGGAGDVVVAGEITGDVSLSKSGSGTTTLMNAGGNTYTGGTTIRNGTLRIQGSNWGPITIDGDKAVLAGTGFIDGDVTLDSGGIAPGDGVTPIGTLFLDSDFHLSPTDSKFNFDLSSVDNSSDLLVMNGIFGSGGAVTFNFSGGLVGETYTLFQFGSTNLTPSDASAFVATGGTGTFEISGDTLTYTAQTVEAVAGYAEWAAANAGGQGPGEDFDLDGVSNGVEFFLNAPAGFTANPQLDGSNTITWTNGGNIPASAYGTQFKVETSGNLVDWIDVPAGELVSNTDGPGGELTYTLTGVGRRFVRLAVDPE